jgi:hypothetical protein
MLEEIALAISSGEAGVGIVSSFSIWAVSSAVALAVTSVASGCIFYSYFNILLIISLADSFGAICSIILIIRFLSALTPLL